MALQTATGIDYGDGNDLDFTNSLEIPSDCSFSVGQSVETSSRFEYDFTRTSQATTRCKRPMAKTFSVSYTLRRPFVTDLWEALASVEDCTGKLGTFYYDNVSFGKVLVVSASITLEADAADGISAIGVGLELVEGLEPAKPRKRLKPQTYRG